MCNILRRAEEKTWKIEIKYFHDYLHAIETKQPYLYILHHLKQPERASQLWGRHCCQPE